MNSFETKQRKRNEIENKYNLIINSIHFKDDYSSLKCLSILILINVAKEVMMNMEYFGKEE